MNLIEIKNEINTQIADKETFNTLIATTFKGLQPATAKRAMLEGMMRGYKFTDFLQKNVYAIPFKDTYSLVTSIDYARKIGAKSGIVGSKKPEYEFDEEGNINSCIFTVQKKTDNYIGDYTALVYFSEYSSGYNLWKSKPKTMIAKVAEMHALRKACPEELSQVYVEEEHQSEVFPTDNLEEKYKQEVDAIETVEALRDYYQANKGLGKDFDKYVTKRKAELSNS